MLDRHAVQELFRAGAPLGTIARQFGVSRRTIRRIKREAPITSPVPRTTHPGRPGVRVATRERLRALVLAEPTLPPGELWRRLREDGKPLGLGTVYRLLAEVRATLPAELLVRFEGVAGEFAQFDFGEVSVRLVAGTRRVVHFAAYRLKYSRWMHVALVPDERVEALIRALLAGFGSVSLVPCEGPYLPKGN